MQNDIGLVMFWTLFALSFASVQDAFTLMEEETLQGRCVDGSQPSGSCHRKFYKICLTCPGQVPKFLSSTKKAQGNIDVTIQINIHNKKGIGYSIVYSISQNYERLQCLDTRISFPTCYF